MSIPRVLPGIPPELVVYDRPSRCPYLPGRVARMPLRLPSRRLSREELDDRLMAGDRRQGFVLYRTACPTCQACEPIRLNVEHFRPSRTQQRVFRVGERRVKTEIGEPVVDRQRLNLYNRHKQGRGLSDNQPAIDAEGYRDFLVSSCCDSFEMRYRVAGELVGVAVVDRSSNALSAVYCYFEPKLSKLSLGTYSILKQLELCRLWGLKYLYLGLYIEDCRHMVYKARFLPHERFVGGRWVVVDRSCQQTQDDAGMASAAHFMNESS